jgi:hypothetical protein
MYHYTYITYTYYIMFITTSSLVIMQKIENFKFNVWTQIASQSPGIKNINKQIQAAVSLC